ncbi:MAG: energy-coupling factor transporter ATPase [Acholeplasmataceae bacterium]|nr:energy-coupling factor transporter ATPase [Acholeplasmataceae bacterium]HOA63881.1 energy-coupling factor transporter ATPase [Bacilli bacterium]HPT88977.1 energy-coupling factor transporter ATPase [Bacilli bacterium]HQA19662.1 energy-coupling factor transporter ATPase [Bacilli bacterium]
MGINFQEVSFAYYIPRKKRLPINFILRDINLHIDFSGEFIAIVGHTGSGKSTLVQLMNALNLPTTGKVIIDDKVITAKPKFKLKNIRKQVGLVFQFPEYQIFEETVLTDIMFGPKNFGYSLEEARERAIEAAKIVGLEEELLNRSPFTLSGGQMRKVAIAGIIASDPQVVVLDEPTVGLDPKTKEELLLFLEKLNTEKNKTIILITHDMDVVGRFCKRVIVMKKGQVVFDGPKNELFLREDLKETYNLDYPEVMQIMRNIRNKLNIDLDVCQYTAYDAYCELKRKLGDKNE